MLTSIEHLASENSDWQQLYQRLSQATTLTAIVLAAWQMGLWLANHIVCQHLQERAQQPTQWEQCCVWRTTSEQRFCPSSDADPNGNGSVETTSGTMPQPVFSQSKDSVL